MTSPQPGGPHATTPAGAAAASGLTHVRPDGTAHMVDVSAKAVTAREASAAGRVLLSEAAVAALRGGTDLAARLATLMPDTTFCNGFLAGRAGVAHIDG